MRFAYIDSQGNEVPIPSIDALALRIELGAVGPDTQLYDAQADHWGPANTHEIFHSLSRDAGEEGFMAPPPPVASAPPTPSTPAPPASEPEPEPPAPEPPAEEAEGPIDLGLTLAAPQPEPPPEEASDSADDGGIEDIGLDLAPAVEAADAPDAGETGGFDFGDLGSGLEVEGSSLAEDEPGTPDFEDGMALETEMEFTGPGADFGGGAELELEQPMSAFEPDSPPGWMEESGTDEAMDFSAVSAEEEATQETVAPVSDASARDRRTPKDRPSAPKFKKQRSMSGPIILVVLLVAIGIGAVYGWPVLSDLLAERAEPVSPSVVMPFIPEELLPQMRSLAATAIADVVQEVNRNTQAAGVPTEPDAQWLGGSYLGNASRYGGIERFWSSIGDFMDGMRAAEWQSYHDSFVAHVDQAGVAGETAAQLTERADSGFVAAQQRRGQVYTDMETLVGAALDLHAFLLENEATIEYRPGATATSDPNVDPVLEIAASTPQRARMQEMFDEITDALDALGSLDRVTRERLMSAFVARLQQVGFE